MQQAKALLIFCNWEGPSTPAIGITSIATHLLEKGYAVRIFDDAPYLADRSDERTDPREMNLNVKKTDRSRLYTLPAENRLRDFRALVGEFAPDVVGISASRYGFLNGIEYLRLIKAEFPGTLTVVGGAFAMSVPERVMAYDCVDMVCTGDGEKPLAALCAILSGGPGRIEEIEGMWVRGADGRIHRNPLHALFDIDANPPLRFDLFDPRRFYRPVGGRIRRTLPLEIARGCPSRCTNCSVPLFVRRHREIGRWYRVKSLERIEENIRDYIVRYDPEYFFFMSPTFLGFPKKFTEGFIEMYSRYRIPFYIGTRPEHVSESVLGRLKEIGLDRMSVGVECGNESYRKRMLGRSYSNRRLEKAFAVIAQLDLNVATNVMIGLPDETRQMVFETIRLIRKIRTAKTDVTVSIYQAYEETPLYRHCIEKGYFEEGTVINTTVFTPSVANPHMSFAEIEALFHCFNLYVRADESMWPAIDSLDLSTDEGRRRFRQMAEALSETTGTSAVVFPQADGPGGEPTADYPIPFAHC